MRSPVKSWLPVVLFVGILAAGATGCASVTPSERRQYEGLKAAGAVNDPYDPTTAALLNILPGGGDVYNGEWGAFVLDLLFWPVSVAWAIPQGAITAGNKNVRDAVSGH